MGLRTAAEAPVRRYFAIGVELIKRVRASKTNMLRVLAQISIFRSAKGFHGVAVDEEVIESNSTGGHQKQSVIHAIICKRAGSAI